MFIFKVTEPSSILRISIGMPNFEMLNLDSVLLVQWLTESRFGISLLVQWLTESRFGISKFGIPMRGEKNEQQGVGVKPEPRTDFSQIGSAS